jgi:hypothetical protein
MKTLMQVECAKGLSWQLLDVIYNNFEISGGFYFKSWHEGYFIFLEKNWKEILTRFNQ